MPGQLEKSKVDLEKEATNLLLLRFLREEHHSFSRGKKKSDFLSNQPYQKEAKVADGATIKITKGPHSL